MKYTLLLFLSAILSLNASDQKTESEQRKRTAIRAIFQQLVHPITSPAEFRSYLSRVGPVRMMYYDTQVLDENSEVPGEFSFFVRERHRVAGKKPHPRNGLIVHRGYYEAHTGQVYVLDRKAAKYVPAAKCPQVIAGKKKHAEHQRQLPLKLKELQLNLKKK